MIIGKLPFPKYKLDNFLIFSISISSHLEFAAILYIYNGQIYQDFPQFLFFNKINNIHINLIYSIIFIFFNSPLIN